MNLLLINFLSCLSLLVSAGGAKLHPFHVSTSDISYNQKEQKIEVTCSIFTDDFESTLKRDYSAKADLSNKAVHKAMDALVKRYINENLEIRPAGKAVALQYIGFEQDKDAVNIYLESPKTPVFKKIEVENSIMLDVFPDQMNIVHITVNGERKSYRLDYPEHLVSGSF